MIHIVQQVGGSLGLAILSGIAASSTVRFLSHSHQVGQAITVAATVHGYREGFYVAVSFSILAS